MPLMPLDLLSLNRAISELRDVIANSSAGMSERMQRDTGRLTDALDANVANLVSSLDRAAEAANKATAASNRYAGRLVWATWALVVVTVGLAVITWAQRAC